MNLRLLPPCPLPLRPALAAGLALGLLAWAPAQAAELLKLSPAQAEAAHLRTQVAQTASTTNTGANLVLQGTVMLPSQATDLVSAPVAGVVQAVLVNPGQSVRAATLGEADHFWRIQLFDAVLLDLNLPVGPVGQGMGSGLSLLRAARARGDQVPVLVLTGCCPCCSASTPTAASSC